MKELNQKQLLFCHEYLKDFNATQAAIRAGYSEKSARAIASQLLTNLNIRQEVDKLSKGIFKAIGLSADRIISEIVSIAFASKSSNPEKLKALDTLLKYELNKPSGSNNLAESAERIMQTLANMRQKGTLEK